MIHAVQLDSGESPDVVSDPAVVEGYLEDASGSAPGRAAGVARVTTEVSAAALLRRAAGEGTPLLFQAARSSLTGGAVPRGELVVSVQGLDRVGTVDAGGAAARIAVGAGVRLSDLQAHLARSGHYYPPVPTYQEAMIGGTVSTNAGGAASFKYGVTRDWVRAIRVVLANGDLLEVERGQARAAPGEHFEIALGDGRVLRVPATSHRLPPLKKISAGYHAAEALDLVDLFVGSEGTLGLITEVTLDLVAAPAGLVTGLFFVDSTAAMLKLAAELRDAANRCRAQGDPRGPDVRAIESLDGQCLELLRRCGAARRSRVEIPEEAAGALLFELELPDPLSDELAQDQLAAFMERSTDVPDVALTRLCAILGRHDALDRLHLALPQDEKRRRDLTQLREATPTRVSEILAERSREQPGLHKVGGDMIVPFVRLPEMVEAYETAFAKRSLEFAIWGHVSDGNLHANALPRNRAEMELGLRALLELGDEAIRLGGAPLSEHGVGRSPLKQELLRRFVGEAAIGRMREIKRVLDPGWRLAPGVLFPPPPPAG